MGQLHSTRRRELGADGRNQAARPQRLTAECGIKDVKGLILDRAAVAVRLGAETALPRVGKVWDGDARHGAALSSMAASYARMMGGHTRLPPFAYGAKYHSSRGSSRAIALFS